MKEKRHAQARQQVIELARSGTSDAHLSATFGMSDATIDYWIKQEQIGRGEVDGFSTDQALELAVAKRRIRQFETELAVSRKVNEIFLEGNLPQKALPGDRFPDRALEKRAGYKGRDGGSDE